MRCSAVARSLFVFLCVYLSLTVVGISDAHATSKQKHYYQGKYSGTLSLTRVIDESTDSTRPCSADQTIKVKLKIKEKKSGDIQVTDKNGVSYIVSGFGDRSIQFQQGGYSNPYHTGVSGSFTAINGNSAEASFIFSYDSLSSFPGRCVYFYSGSTTRR